MKKLIVLLTGLALLLFGSVAYADVVLDDPSDIHINDGTAFLYAGGTEVHPIINNSLDISLAGNHNGVNITPLYLVLGVPDSTTLTPDISSINGAPFTSNAALKGTLSGPGNPDVYGDVLSLSGMNNSNNLVNWTTAEFAVNDITAQYFGIMQYSLTGVVLNQNNPVNDITFADTLPAGTFAIAYGYGSDNKAYCTPFTESGLTQVPEPGTLMLLGSGLVGIAFYRRRRK